MINLLLKIFVKDYKNTNNDRVRQRYGVFSGILGIVLNVILCASKAVAGILTGAISITADAFNNLADAGSSVVTMLGFAYAGREADDDHPFGHGRIEYIAGLLVSIAILIMGFQLVVTSFEKIFNASIVEFSLVSIIILAVSVVVKFWMFLYNRKLAKDINSQALKAISADSISDTVATSVVLVGSIISYKFNVNIDAYLGIAVSAFIIFSGYNACKDTISPLIGEKPDMEMVRNIAKCVMSHKEILGMHDVVFHNYGVGRYMVTLHAEVDGSQNVMELHDIIDDIERDLRNEFNVEATLHMDPIETDDIVRNETKLKVLKLVRNINKELTIHDFRMTSACSHCNLIFDVVKPSTVNMTNSELVLKIEEQIRTLSNDEIDYYCVVKVDHKFI